MLENISQYRKEGKRAADNLKDPLRRKCFGRHVKARPAAAAQGARVSVFQLERVEMSELALQIDRASPLHLTGARDRFSR